MPELRRRWRSLPRFWQAFLLGLAVTILSLALFILLLRAWPYGNLAESDRLIVQLAIGQVFTGFAAIMLTVTLGSFAVWEFMERRALPEIDLGLADTDLDDPAGYKQLRITHLSISDPENYKVTLVLSNSGAATAVWYRLEVRIPFLKREDLVVNELFQPLSLH